MSSIHSVTAESQKMTVACYKIQDTLEYSSLLRQEITNFAIELHYNVAKISAVDLLDVNLDSLSRILAATVTYFVVIFQLKDS